MENVKEISRYAKYSFIFEVVCPVCLKTRRRKSKHINEVYQHLRCRSCAGKDGDDITFAMKRVSKDAITKCWNWTGPTSLGYGRVTRKFRGASKAAHRFVWELLRGKIPKGLVLDHLCKNTLCVNPEHLRLCTQKDNLWNGNSPPAVNGRKTHCKNGHEFTPENTYINPKTGYRNCRECLRSKDRKRWPARYARWKEQHQVKT